MPRVKLWVIVLIVVGANAIAALAMLALRRRAPSGGYFHDSQLAAGALAVTGTVYAVLVGFVFLLAFQSYETARSSSQDEAVATIGLFQSRISFPRATATSFRPTPSATPDRSSTWSGPRWRTNGRARWWRS